MRRETCKFYSAWVRGALLRDSDFFSGAVVADSSPVLSRLKCVEQVCKNRINVEENETATPLATPLGCLGARDGSVSGDISGYRKIAATLVEISVEVVQDWPGNC